MNPLFRSVFFLLLALAPVTGALAEEDSVERELRALLDTFLAGASRNDAAIHERFWAEDLVYTSATGARRGKAETMAALREPRPADAPEPPRYHGEDVDVRVFGDFAVITFRLVAGMPDDTIAQFYNTGVFARRDGRWQAFTWQATRIPDSPSAQ
jgi:ketosteroid isomerase-like protein